MSYDITESIKRYLEGCGQDGIKLRAVLFDMDGVLFNSMPSHAWAWSKAMRQFGLNMTEEEAFLHEGRTGSGTINVVSQREWGRDATADEVETIYKVKSDLFNSLPEPPAMKGALELLDQLREAGLTRILVTGSGQGTLLNRLDRSFPGHFVPQLMVTASDVRYGKPNPEPYLMALQKGNLQPSQAVVVENAPLGVRAAVAAGIYTIAVNTGPLSEEVLWREGAGCVLPSMQALSEAWPSMYTQFANTSLKI